MAVISGLQLVVPSSVSASTGTASVSASGKVTYSGVAILTINGCFSSTYTNYMMVMRGYVNSANNIQWRLQAGGSIANGSNYHRQHFSTSGTTVTSFTNSPDSIGRISAWNTDHNGSINWFWGPQKAARTSHRAVSSGGASNAVALWWSNTHDLSTAYDGLLLYGDASVQLTGSLTIYGLAE